MNKEKRFANIDKVAKPVAKAGFYECNDTSFSTEIGRPRQGTHSINRGFVPTKKNYFNKTEN